jgi:succinate-semialdehyde dehydrogenase/glutarate-semialdehyde dehydrogenase
MSKFAVTNANTGEVEEEFASVPVEEIPRVHRSCP